MSRSSARVKRKFSETPHPTGGVLLLMLLKLPKLGSLGEGRVQGIPACLEYAALELVHSVLIVRSNMRFVGETQL